MTTATATPPARARIAAVVAVLALLALAALLVFRGGGSDAAVSVYPDHRTLAASPETAITFRGVGPDELEDVEVRGSRSGAHPGELRPHPDDDGAVFVPDEPFQYGERVTVDAGVDVIGVPGQNSSFVVARRNAAPEPPDDQAKEPVDAGVQTFASQPGLHPPAIRVDQSSDAARAGSIFVAPKRGATQQGPMIIDRSGELVWFDPLPGNDQAFDFRAQTYKGKPVLTWWQGRMQLYRGGGVGRIVDERYQPVATVRAGNG